MEQSKRTKTAAKRKPNLTPEELLAIAEENGVGELYAQLVHGLEACFVYKYTTLSSLGFIGVINGSRRTIFSLVPGKSSPGQGVHFEVYLDRLADYLGADEGQVRDVFPAGVEVQRISNDTEVRLRGHFKTPQEAERCISALCAYRRE